MKKEHLFDNGVKVYDHQLLPIQRERYKSRNVHEEEEEDLFVKIIGGLHKDAVYVSVGTAIGYYPLLAKRLKNDINVHCFEPLPLHLEYLKENMELNGLAPSAFSVYDVAVSTEHGEVSFANESYGSSIVSNPTKEPLMMFLKNMVKRLLGRATYHLSISVKSIPMIDLFDLIKSPTVDFLQMDIQGFEQPVLEKYFADLDSSKRVIKSFLIGTHSIEIHKACKSLFEKNGYSIILDEYETQHQPDGIIYCEIDG